MTPPPTHLPCLTPHEAITDALHRCTLGLDTNNRPLFESACLKGPSMSVTAGTTVLNGWDEINSMFDRVFNLITTHLVTNIRVETKEGETDDKGREVARLTAHAMSWHVREEDAFTEGDKSYRASSLYDVVLVRDEGDGEGALWKIRNWGIRVLWTTGDVKILHG